MREAFSVAGAVRRSQSFTVSLAEAATRPDSRHSPLQTRVRLPIRSQLLNRVSCLIHWSFIHLRLQSLSLSFFPAKHLIPMT